MLLAGDIGGTKTDLALYAPDADLRTPVAEITLPSAWYPSLEAMVGEFLRRTGAAVDRATFGVAGPVVSGEAKITNLPWTITERGMAAALGVARVGLLNDLEAVGHAVPFLRPEDVSTLSAGKPVDGGTMAVLAPGTGLGEGFLTCEKDGQYSVHPSEGGHCDFAPTNGDEIELLRHLLGTLDHVSYERVCSGIGIPNIYAFLKDTGRYEEPPELAEQLAGVTNLKDQTPIIMDAARRPEGAPAISVKTAEMFVSILAAEAGNLALKVLATGGVYLGGGIPPRIVPLLATERFLAEFQRKGRFAHLLDDVPVHVILNPKVALLGAAQHARRM